MNHRELVLSSTKKPRHAFLSLPEDLADEVIEGLDGQTLTLEGARDFLAERGHRLSHEAIAGYYRAVRRERRLYDETQELTRIFETFQDTPLEESILAMMKFLVAKAVRAASDGEVGFKDVNLGSLISAVARLKQAQNSETAQHDSDAAQEKGIKVIDTESLKAIRQQLGL